MRAVSNILINTPDIEVWPGGLLRARSNHDARLLARARHVLRRKRDGRYLAADLPEGLSRWCPALVRERGHGVGTRCTATRGRQRAGRPRATAAPASPAGAPGCARPGCWLCRTHRTVPGRRTGLARASPGSIVIGGLCGCERMPRAHGRACARPRCATTCVLEAISGYRSHAYQLGIFERKLARGLARRRDPRGQRGTRLQRTPLRSRARHRRARRTGGRGIVRTAPRRSPGCADNAAAHSDSR